MDKNFFNKRCHYSIRKLAIGVASVMIGASIFGFNLVEAAETGGVVDKEGTITQAQPFEKLPDELAAVLKKAEENSGKEASSTVGNGENTETIGSTDATNNPKPAEVPRTQENETKPSEAMSGGQNDKVISKLSQPSTPETPKVEQTGDGTVELADQFTASKPASEDSIAAASKSTDYLKKEYKVFPTPQKVTYGEGVTALRKQVNLVMGDQLDIYTRNRLKSVLQDNQVSYTTSQSAVAGATNIYLGVHGRGSQAEQNLSNVSAGLFDKIDAYALTIKDNSISIVGKDTDAVFYGLTTLKHM
ncbi:glycoside hydrolase family 20 zincin-like fold domain-containing protein, partial [Streptococcus pseudopneumoniae]